ncbi:hypothetical protein ACLB2K_019467 [Fragaria x ananassa]
MKKGKGRNNGGGGGGLLPSSLRIISSCLKTVSTNASTVASTVRSAGASVAASISASEDHKDQVTWAGFDRLELGHSAFKRVLLLGYLNGFQVFDVEDASNYSELVSKRDGPVSFLQMQPYPAASDDKEGFRASHPLLLVVAGDDTNGSGVVQNHSNLGGLGRDGHVESWPGNPVSSPTAVRFYSLRFHSYVHVLRFRSAVCMIRCSPRIVAVGLASQIYCFDALTLENKFSVLTYPVPQLAGQGSSGFNVGYGPMAVGPRWLVYASNSPLMSNTSRLGPHNLSHSPGVSPSTSPGNGSYVARYAMESSKQLAAGIINLSDMGCKTLYKYCQELLPDGSSSPVSSNSGWKVSRLAGTEMDNAGMVVVKDFVTRAVISQFKAHTSPISALCFDPSGTLLVTASIYGNNINIFRIMPSCKRNGSGSQNMNWNSSHVHLYKLHRGITSALIQDICFSHYSQWVAIVSSKGTCHVFVLSPFGGDAGFQVQHSQGEEPTLYPVLSLPWWSTSCCIMTQQSFPPPPPVTLSVVSRIKYSSFGWLSTVNNAAGSTTGKVFVPSGAVAAVFHNSLSQSVQHSNSRASTLEYLLVYTPSGHVVQHELQPRVGIEQSHSGLNTQTATYRHTQEEDLRVKVEPIQWWDVCRRSEWPEREDCILGINSDGDVAETIQSKSGWDGTYAMEFLDLNGGVEGKRNLETHWSRNISNAEVQISSFRLPIWQKSKICFYTMECQRGDSFPGGEFEVEKVPIHEIEMRQKELLPVFHQFHSIKSSWNDRVVVGKYSNNSSSESHQAEGKISEQTVICHSNPASLSSTESSEGGSSRRIEHSLDFDQLNNDLPRSPIFQNLNCPERRANAILESSFQIHSSLGTLCAPSEHFKNIGSQVGSGTVLESKLLPVGRFYAEEGLSVKTIGMSEGLDLYTDQHASSTVVVTRGDSNLQRPIDLSQFFLEGHCMALELNGCLSEVITDDSDGSQCDKGKPDDEENGEMLGGMFAFSDEG